MLTFQPLTTTKSAAAVVTAPGAGTTIVSLTGLQAGLWVVFILAGYGAGTAPAAAENANMQVQKGATVLGTLAVPGATGVVPVTMVVELDGSTTLSITAINQGTAGVNYLAGLYVYRA